MERLAKEHIRLAHGLRQCGEGQGRGEAGAGWKRAKRGEKWGTSVRVSII